MRFDSEPMDFDFSGFEEFFKYERWLAYRHMIQYAFDQIFPNRVEQRQVYAVTGNGPFLEDDLLDLFEPLASMSVNRLIPSFQTWTHMATSLANITWSSAAKISRSSCSIGRSSI